MCTRLKENWFFHCPSSGVPVEWKGTGLLKGNRYITYSESSYISYDISGMSASAKEEIPFQSPDFDMWAPMDRTAAGEYTLPIPGESTI